MKANVQVTQAPVVSRSIPARDRKGAKPTPTSNWRLFTEKAGMSLGGCASNRGHNDIRDEVRKRYAEIVSDGGSCCSNRSCCAGGVLGQPDASAKLGYSGDDLSAVPEGANMGLGCGNPQAIAGLQRGDVVLDLGSGGGFDCFLAARRVVDGVQQRATHGGWLLPRH